VQIHCTIYKAVADCWTDKFGSKNKVAGYLRTKNK